jgi:hypothetical protein
MFAVDIANSFTTAVDLVRAHPNFDTTLLSGNIARNRGPAWSAVANGKLCSTKNETNEPSALITGVS